MAYSIKQQLANDYDLHVPLWSKSVLAAKRRQKNLKHRIFDALPLDMQDTLRAKLLWKKFHAIIDCSGFSYGDQWQGSQGGGMRIPRIYHRLKKSGKKIIVLPQAFGPFTSPELKKVIAEFVRDSDLFYAREEISKAHVLSCGVEENEVKVSPDFTCLLPAEQPDAAETWHNRICIVPNQKMISMTDEKKGKAYFSFLTKTIDRAYKLGLEPCIVLHENGDADLAESLKSTSSRNVRILNESPTLTKGILGCCFAVVGSRYHGLVSSISQGVVSIGTSWSHKYEALFADYNCPECLIRNLESNTEFEQVIQYMTDDNCRQSLRQRLTSAAAKEKKKAEDMWKEVKEVLAGKEI